MKKKAFILAAVLGMVALIRSDMEDFLSVVALHPQGYVVVARILDRQLPVHAAAGCKVPDTSLDMPLAELHGKRLPYDIASFTLCEHA